MPQTKPVDSVKVRMYRHGFGDCFLLLFFSGVKRVFTMLIDCGIKYNTKSEECPIESVIEDLRKTLSRREGGAPELDVLVVTHEHWDHVAFFHPTRGGNPFKEFEIGQIWLAWTENPDDKDAKQINSRLRRGVDALGIVAERLQETTDDEMAQMSPLYVGSDVEGARTKFNKSLDDVLGFYGARSTKDATESGIEYKKNGRISKMTQAAMENVANRFDRESGTVKYCEPGTLIEESLLPAGINIYVLGPPKSNKINKSNPSHGDAQETYLSIDRNGMTSFVDAALAMDESSGDQSVDDPSKPFGKGIGVTPESVKNDEFFKKTYFEKQEDYRRIENTWLDIAGQFALQLDGAINNTSLVLAIEFADSGKVLLFPGDAQVGSWLSWHDYNWKVPNGETNSGRKQYKTVDATDLLNNTVLYKVSHHGSHNATVKDGGLEQMTHAGLVAMIPEKEDSYSGILYEDLMIRLNQLCKGRVIVSADEGHPPDKIKDEKPANLSDTEWKAFKNCLVVNETFVEIEIK